MADRYLLESGAPDGYLLEDGSGVLLLEQQAGATFVLHAPQVVCRVAGRPHGARATVRLLRARQWGNTGSVAATLPAVAASAAGTHPVLRGTVVVVARLEGERRRRGAKASVHVVRARRWGNTGDLASALPAAGAALGGTVVNPIGGDLASTLAPLAVVMANATATGRTFIVEC